MTAFFVRNDDIGDLTEDLQVFVDLFADRRIPVSYQVIPERLTDTCAAFLKERAQTHPGLIEIGQHGLRHEMTLKGRRLKREFGPERTLQQQEADIAEGLRLMRLRLGDAFAIEVFTPPQHKFDRNTVVCAAKAGHRVFSAADYPSSHHRLAYALGRWLGLSSIAHHGISYNGGTRPEAAIFERSISVAVDNGRFVCLDAGLIDAAVAKAARGGEPIGFMFHHAVYAGPDGRQTLTAIADKLVSLGATNFHRLGDLATARDAGRVRSPTSMPAAGSPATQSQVR